MNQGHRKAFSLQWLSKFCTHAMKDLSANVCRCQIGCNCYGFPYHPPHEKTLLYLFFQKDDPSISQVKTLLALTLIIPGGILHPAFKGGSRGTHDNVKVNFFRGWMLSRDRQHEPKMSNRFRVWGLGFGQTLAMTGLGLGV